MKAFSKAISSGSLGELTNLNLDCNNISDAGMVCFTDAIASGALGSLSTLLVDNTTQALEDACSSRNISLW